MQFTSHYSSSIGNLYTVESGNETLLIECGVPIKTIREALNFRLSEVSGCLVSHGHQDHCKALGDLEKASIDCYMSRETAEAIGADSHRTHIIEPLKQFSVGSFKIVPFSTEHDCPGSLGFLIAANDFKLVFATDTFYLRPQFLSVTHLAIECNYSKETLSPDIDPVVKRRLFRSHMSLETLIKMLKTGNWQALREIHLLHLSRQNSDAEYFKKAIESCLGIPCYIASSVAKKRQH